MSTSFPQLAGSGGEPSGDTAALQAAILAHSPTAYLPLQETSGTVAEDLGSNAADGTYTGGVRLGAPGPTDDGYSAWFDGLDDRVTIGAPFFTAVNNFTMLCWYKPRQITQLGALMANNDGQVLLHGTDTGSGSAGNFALLLYDFVGWFDSSAEIGGGGGFVQVAVVRAAGTTRIYLDARDTGISPADTPSAANTSAFIGQRPDGSARVRGNIAHVATFTTALTANQLAALRDTAGFGG